MKLLRRFPALMLCLMILFSSLAFAEPAKSNDRGDYPELTDAEFANFRMIRTGDITEGILFRSSSPINEENGRNAYADAELEPAGIRYVINLADTEESAQAHEGYAGSVYSGLNVLYLDMSRDFTSKHDRAGFVEMIRWIGENPGPFLVHCDEGKTRAGFACMLLECLTGAEPDEVLEDYMLSYVNYYKMQPGSDEYDKFAAGVRATLMFLCGGKSMDSEVIRKAAEKYLLDSGSTAEELAAAIDRLTSPIE